MLKKIIIAVVVLAALGGAYGLYLFNKEVEGLETVEADAALSAEKLFTAFENDEQEANTMYLGKVLEVSGQVANVNTDAAAIVVNMESGSDFGYVQCKMDSNQTAVDFKAGDEIRLKCQCTGYLMDVVLNRCVVSKN
ncbi:MAG: OB-fold protein [Luteibaculum sp.]